MPFLDALHYKGDEAFGDIAVFVCKFRIPFHCKPQLIQVVAQYSEFSLLISGFRIPVDEVRYKKHVSRLCGNCISCQTRTRQYYELSFFKILKVKHVFTNTSILFSND